MHTIVNPQQARLFDPFDRVLTEKTRKRLIKRFLTQLKRHSKTDYQALDESLRNRYAPGVNQLFADTHYCSDENIRAVADRGVELVGPVPCGSLIDKDVDRLNVDDFNIDEQTEEIICCPAGHKPVSSIHDKQTGKTKTVMPSSTCRQCEFRKECPMEKCRDGYCLYHTAKQRRLAGRRREENTDVFRDRYRIRGGIEGTNSGLKRKTGLGQLRVRGRPAVFQAIYLKIAGWNMFGSDQACLRQGGTKANVTY